MKTKSITLIIAFLVAIILPSIAQSEQAFKLANEPSEPVVSSVFSGAIPVYSLEKNTSIDQEHELDEEIEKKEESGLSFSGSLDVYYRLNFNGDFENSPATSFANLSGFSLGMINLLLTQKGKKVGFTADIVVGPRGAEAVFGSQAPLNLVNQLYSYWNVNDKITFTLGNFNTFLGYEVISPTANFNYSTSYLFSYGPFSHTGLKADIDLGKGFSVMAGVFNPTDFTDFNPFNSYAGGTQLSYDFGKGSVYLNSLFDVDFFQIDLTAGLDVNDKIYLGVNASSASNSFYGGALYAQFAATDAFKIGARFEYFYDEGIDVLGAQESVFDATLSAKYTINNLTIIPEFRIDLVSKDIFNDGNGGYNDSLTSGLLAVVYEF